MGEAKRRRDAGAIKQILQTWGANGNLPACDEHVKAILADERMRPASCAMIASQLISVALIQLPSPELRDLALRAIGQAALQITADIEAQDDGCAEDQSLDACMAS